MRELPQINMDGSPIVNEYKSKAEATVERADSSTWALVPLHQSLGFFVDGEWENVFIPNETGVI